MIALLKNIPMIVAVLWQLGWKVPKVFAVIRAIVAILGTEQFQNLIESIGGIAKTETEKLPQPPDTEPIRRRLLYRIRQQFALNQLGMTEPQYTAFCDKNGVAGPIIDEQSA